MLLIIITGEVPGNSSSPTLTTVPQNSLLHHLIAINFTCDFRNSFLDMRNL